MGAVRKLILNCQLSPGDIVFLTAAVRDLHACYPGQFLTDVRTRCQELWDHNPHITPLTADDPEVESLDCSYPLIDRSNDSACHGLHGFIEFLNEKLGLLIRLTSFKGDIHLSPEEKLWCSQVEEIVGQDIPFWIVAAGGKYDVTIKWWSTERYQAVVDRLRSKIQFVQVGAPGHYHPRLKGTIDFRGETSLRQLVRLVYHAQGVLCGVTALMHLSAAVPIKAGGIRPCVVVAGGREPAHWEAYPGHQFLSTNGILPCCQGGGCWRARTLRLGDGNERDGRDHLCVDVVDSLPRCMHLITPAEVVRRIALYFVSGERPYLSVEGRMAARRAVERSTRSDYDEAPLTLHNARIMCEQFIRSMPRAREDYAGRGIVICGGGVKYFTCAWVCIRMLRQMDCQLPIELWHLGEKEVDKEMKVLLAPFGVQCIDATALTTRFPIRRLGGWELKPYAILHSRFQEVLFLDADNVVVRNPEPLFDCPQYRATGAVFWPDFGRLEKSQVIWDSCGLLRPPGPEFESGQILVDKEKCSSALRLALWFNEHSDFYYRHLHGDKETFHLAFHKLKKPYGMVETPIHRLDGTMCQHDFQGQRLFQHRNTDKWNLFLRNRRVEGFWFEDQCFAFLSELRACWDGRKRRFRPKRIKAGRATRRSRGEPSIKIVMISCAEREPVRRRTLEALAKTDWADEPACVVIDQGEFECRQARQTHTAWRALEKSLSWKTDYVLFLEDDLEFNFHLCHNLRAWTPLREGQVTLAGLYNPGLAALAWDTEQDATIVAKDAVFGSQAFLLSRSTVEYLVAHWSEAAGMQDIRMSRLAGHISSRLYYHSPSLVQHIGGESVWGGPPHEARDFDLHWRAQG